MAKEAGVTQRPLELNGMRRLVRQRTGKFRGEMRRVVGRRWCRKLQARASLAWRGTAGEGRSCPCRKPFAAAREACEQHAGTLQRAGPASAVAVVCEQRSGRRRTGGRHARNRRERMRSE